MKLIRMCSVCGKEPAKIKGMCVKCYKSQWSKANYAATRKRPPRDHRSEQTKEIIQKYALGASQVELANEYGLTRQRVSYIIKQAGIKKC